MSREDVTFRIHHLEQHLVLAARHAHQDEGIALRATHPLPGQVVEGDVQVPDPRRQATCGPPPKGRMAFQSKSSKMFWCELVINAPVG